MNSKLTVYAMDLYEGLRDDLDAEEIDNRVITLLAKLENALGAERFAKVRALGAAAAELDRDDEKNG